MHPAEASTHNAEKRAGVYDTTDTLPAGTVATAALATTVTIKELNAAIAANSLAVALDNIEATYGNAAELWEHYERTTPTVTYTFHIAAPDNLDGMTEDQARDYLADTYPCLLYTSDAADE